MHSKKQNFKFIYLIKSFLLILVFLINIKASKCQIQETRAVWIATISNIDFPPSRKLSTLEQQKAITDMLDDLKKIKINTIYFQIRPAADAFYNSSFEPWSYYLNGKKGRPPEPFYDPFEFIINEGHLRNIDVEAWINPFRAETDTGRIYRDEYLSHIPQICRVKYDNKLYINPGIPDCRNYVLKIVDDIISRYDLDGVHLDDYYYPYPKKNEKFDDENTYNEYNTQFTNKFEWRKNNIDDFIMNLNKLIKSKKKYLNFGVSPFGVWRNISKDPKGSKTNTMSSYDDLHADILLWIEKGWIDYVIPQLYWDPEGTSTNFNELLNWWNNAVNNTKTKLIIGLPAYRVNFKQPGKYDINTINKKLTLMKQMPNVSGFSLYSANSILKNLNSFLEKSFKEYSFNDAIKPEINTDEPFTLMPPDNIFYIKDNGYPTIYWSTDENNKKNQLFKNFMIYVVPLDYDKENKNNDFYLWKQSTSNNMTIKELNFDKNKFKIYITTIDRYNRQSEPSKIKRIIVR